MATRVPTPNKIAATSEEREHRRFSPSQIARIKVCPGSVPMVEKAPALPSPDYTIEGQNAHTVLEYALVNQCRKAKEAHREYSHLSGEDLNTQENLFYFSVDMCLDYVYEILDTFPDAQLFIENYVDVPCEAAPGEADGYCDVAIYVPSQRLLYIIDYKHGAGIAVDVIGNKQMRQYGAGVLYGEVVPVSYSDVDTVRLVIVQPRAVHKAGSIREDDLTPWDLYEYLTEMNEIITASLSPTAPLVPTIEHCRFCAAKTVCPAREKKALAPLRNVGIALAPENVRKPMLPDPEQMDTERLGQVLLAAPALRAWLKDLEAHAYSLLRSGHVVPGHKLVEVHPKREYYGDDEDIASDLALVLGCNPDDLLRKKLLPITEMEKLLVQHYRKTAKKGEKNKASEQARQDFAFYTLKKSTGNLTMVTLDDERPAVNGASSAFKQIEGKVGGG